MRFFTPEIDEISETIKRRIMNLTADLDHLGESLLEVADIKGKKVETGLHTKTWTKSE